MAFRAWRTSERHRFCDLGSCPTTGDQPFCYVSDFVCGTNRFLVFSWFIGHKRCTSDLGRTSLEIRRELFFEPEIVSDGFRLLEILRPKLGKPRVSHRRPVFFKHFLWFSWWFSLFFLWFCCFPSVFRETSPGILQLMCQALRSPKRDSPVADRNLAPPLRPAKEPEARWPWVVTHQNQRFFFLNDFSQLVFCFFNHPFSCCFRHLSFYQ